MKKIDFYSTILTLGKKSKLFMLSLNRMVLFAFSVLLAIAACTNKPVAAVENNEESSEVFPNPNLPRLCFIKNVVKNLRIIIGDYTYYETGTSPWCSQLPFLIC